MGLKNTLEELMDLDKIVARMQKDDSHFYPVNLPDAESGPWNLRKRIVTEHDCLFANMRMVRDGYPEYVVTPGTYQVLTGPMGVMMSNTQLEHRTNRDFVENAKGDVLVIGLGIGMLLGPLSAKRCVKSITVLELEPDVLKMVKPHYEAMPKVRIFEADAFDFEPDDLMGTVPSRWDRIMIDIWPDIGPANLPDMKKLHGRYAQWVKPGGKVTCWSMDICRRMKREEDRYARQMGLAV